MSQYFRPDVVVTGSPVTCVGAVVSTLAVVAFFGADAELFLVRATAKAAARARITTITIRRSMFSPTSEILSSPSRNYFVLPPSTFKRSLAAACAAANRAVSTRKGEHET